MEEQITNYFKTDYPLVNPSSLEIKQLDDFHYIVGFLKKRTGEPIDPMVGFIRGWVFYSTDDGLKILTKGYPYIQRKRGLTLPQGRYFHLPQGPTLRAIWSPASGKVEYFTNRCLAKTAKWGTKESFLDYFWKYLGIAQLTFEQYLENFDGGLYFTICAPEVMPNYSWKTDGFIQYSGAYSSDMIKLEHPKFNSNLLIEDLPLPTLTGIIPKMEYSSELARKILDQGKELLIEDEDQIYRYHSPISELKSLIIGNTPNPALRWCELNNTRKRNDPRDLIFDSDIFDQLKPLDWDDEWTERNVLCRWQVYVDCATKDLKQELSDFIKLRKDKLDEIYKYRDYILGAKAKSLVDLKGKDLRSVEIYNQVLDRLKTIRKQAKNDYVFRGMLFHEYGANLYRIIYNFKPEDMIN